MSTQKRKYIDINFYKVFLGLLRVYTPYYKNMDKDYKYCIGQNIFNLILECSEMNIDSYYEDDPQIKYEISLKSYKILLKIEVLIRYLYDLRILSIEQIGTLSKETSLIKTDLYNWKNALYKSISKN